jgi:hypothetical protein
MYNVYHIFLIHWSLVGSVGCVQSLAIVNSAAINLGVQVALLYPGAHSLRCMVNRGITWSYHRSIFSFLRNCCTTFHRGCTNLHYHQQCVRVLPPQHPHACQHLLLIVLLMIAILILGRWNLSVILTWLSFMAKDVEQFFMYLLSTCIWSFKNCLFSSFFHSFDGLLILCRVRFLSFLKNMVNKA